LIDVEAERQRLEKNLERVTVALGRSRKNLANKNFCANAPDDVIARERAKVATMEQEIMQFDEQLARLALLN
jgi:valyl-tRNA synthetase